MTAALVAIENLDAALQSDAPGAEELADKVGAVLWVLAGMPPLVPPPPPPLAAALAAIPLGEDD